MDYYSGQLERRAGFGKAKADAIDEVGRLPRGSGVVL
jgi:hypothetical protein